MRIAALASMVVLAPDAGRGCLGSGEPPIEVRWTLPDGPGERGVRYVGCLDWSFEKIPAGQEDGDLRGGLAAKSGWSRCALIGWRRDGQLLVQTDPIPLDGESVWQEITFDLIDGPIGGMGAAIESTGAGVLVHEVVPGSAADRAGIVPGDLIVEVDGSPTRHLTTQAFIRRATGVPGTPVAIRVLRNGETSAIALERARVP